MGGGRRTWRWDVVRENWMNDQQWGNWGDTRWRPNDGKGGKVWGPFLAKERVLGGGRDEKDRRGNETLLDIAFNIQNQGMKYRIMVRMGSEVQATYSKSKSHIKS